MKKIPFSALQVPPAALEHSGVEVLRAALVHGELHLSLRRAFDEPEGWGMLIADLVKHVAHIFRMEMNLTEEAVHERVLKKLTEEMQKPASSEIGPRNN